jgi:hypothetical protein
VVQEHWPDVHVGELDPLVKVPSYGVKVWCDLCVPSQTAVEVAGPCAVSSGACEAAEVGARHAVHDGQWFSEFIQEAVGWHGLTWDCGLCRPRGGGFQVRGE